MTDAALLADFRQWQSFRDQERLNREHESAQRQLEQSGAMATRLAEAYRSMAERGAAEGACYRTLFTRQQQDGSTLACECWLFVRKVIAERGTTRVRAGMLETFDLETGRIAPKEQTPVSITLELFDQISVGRGSLMSCRVDRHDQPEDTHFVTFLDQVQNLKSYMQKTD